MTSKAKTSKKLESLTPIQKIEALQSCIAADESKLMASYEKAIAQTEKPLAQWQARLSKAKAKLSSARSKQKQAAEQHKAKKGKATAIRLEKAIAATLTAKQALEAIQLALYPLQQTLKELLAARKKCIAKQKIILKFEQEWQKASEAAIRGTQKKRAKKASPEKTVSSRKPQEKVPSVGSVIEAEKNAA